MSPVVRDLAKARPFISRTRYQMRFRRFCVFCHFWPRSRSPESDVSLSTSINARRLIEFAREETRNAVENRLCKTDRYEKIGRTFPLMRVYSVGTLALGGQRHCRRCCVANED